MNNNRGLMRPTLPTESDFRSPLHHERVLARLGLWLGASLVICFITGMVSHYQQNPVSWLPLGPDPAWGYQVNQGLHVITGTAMLPLLLAKLYAAYPRLFAKPPVRGLVHGLERLGIAVLIAATSFQIITGLMNVVQWYPWGFGFTGAHQAVAWLALGGLGLHVAAKLPVTRRALATAPPTSPAALPGAISPAAEDEATRRGFMAAVLTVTGVTALLTAGQTVYPLRQLALLAPRRPDVGPQQLPVNRTAAAAAVTVAMTGPQWRLELVGPAGVQMFSLDDLVALPGHTVRLPIACVEGWSAQATWTGVRIQDLVGLAGGGPASDVRFESLQRRGGFATSLLPANFAADPRSLLALRLNGEVLHPDHGYPARVIAPNRPGVLQTKWIRRIVVGGSGEGGAA